MSFEEMLLINRCYVERYVRFRVSSKADADDVLQEVYLSAFNKFEQLKNKESFKPWLISIARNKCNDYFRKKAVQFEISIEDITETALQKNQYGIPEKPIVADTVELLSDKDKQILYLFYWKELSQNEIAQVLNIPIGTVKSRLYTAKQNFKTKYPCHTDRVEGERNMNKLPIILPEYKIKKVNKAPFAVKCEELRGWFIIPKLGEKLSWAMYEMPSRRCSSICEMEVTGKAIVHGIEGVELKAKEVDCVTKEVFDRTFIAQLTDTHCRYLALIQDIGDVRTYTTFLDSDEFISDWGFGEDNCGREVNIISKGDIVRNDNEITTSVKENLLDVVGRYTITINEKNYDTVCVMDIEKNNCGNVALEQYIDKNGKTVLLRRYNQDNWAMNHYKKKWSELLPENEQLIINGEIYVHWYDCITDYVL